MWRQLQDCYHGVGHQVGLRIFVRIELLARIGLRLRQVGGPRSGSAPDLEDFGRGSRRSQMMFQSRGDRTKSAESEFPILYRRATSLCKTWGVDLA
jgi:hypothetical protein